MHHNMVVNDKKKMPYFDGKMPYLVLPRRKSKCLRENRKLAKPKFMFYQSLTRIWHNLQVHVESQIKFFFHIAETSKIALIGLLLSNRVLSKILKLLNF